MRLRRIIAGLLAMLAVAVSASAGQRSIESDQETLISLERDWNEAFYQKKVDVIEKLLADEFMATYDDGSRGDKARELKLTRDFDQRVESAIQEAFVVKVYGNTGVVWFTLHLVGIKQGQRSELDLSYTDIWVLRAGRWLCVSSQSTRVNPK